MSEPTATDRPLRADAERNRLKILVAAREVFADRGFVASLDDVAAHAGVGVGTVYRRFPDKDALIDALFEDRLGEIAEIGRRALEADDPWEGLVSFLSDGIALQAGDRGLRQAMLSRGGDRADRVRATINPIAGALIGRAQQSGAVRADLDLMDLPLINMMVAAIADLTRDVSPEVYRRMFQIVLDGLVTSRCAPTPLPTGAIDQGDLLRAVAARGFP